MNPGTNTTRDFSEKIRETIHILESLHENPEEFAKLSDEERAAITRAAGRISRPDHIDIVRRRKEVKKSKKEQARLREKLARASTGIRKARTETIFTAPIKLLTDQRINSEAEPVYLNSPRNCYVCKAEFTRLHFFYDSMCPKCAELNYEKRFQRADLTGQVAIITGARVKIGYQAALMMLQSGATVIVTTRFPVDAAKRYALEKDFPEWKDRLHIFGLDLRHTPSVEIFCSYFESRFDRLDILINNAAQTVRRPPGFYAHLMGDESLSFEDLNAEVRHILELYSNCRLELSDFNQNSLSKEKALPVSWQGPTPGMGILSSANLSQVPYSHDLNLSNDEIFPVNRLDADLQQVDLRETNSWRLKLGEIPVSEMVELQLVNSIAPFVLCNRLVKILKKDYTGQKHIVNVTAMEGKFYRFKKADRHPHTNMAKAALNMLTHTSASSLADEGIFMNAVDTGWVTDEDPAHLSKEKQERHDFQPPLDIVDGAARICDPFIDGINSGNHVFGKFLKDYFPIDW